MTEQSKNVLTFNNVDETSVRTFHVTGIAEHWPPIEGEEQEDVFTKTDFEKALKKVSRRVKK